MSHLTPTIVYSQSNIIWMEIGKKRKAYRSNREAIPFRLFPTVGNQNKGDQLLRGLQEEVDEKSSKVGMDRS